MTHSQLIVDAEERPQELTPAQAIPWSMDPDAAVALGSPDAAREPLVEVNKQFGRNVITTIVARVVNMARGVCLVPFLLAHIGLEAYGIWTTIFILVTYVGLTTMGVSNVYIKYVAEFTAKREYDRANALLSTGLAVTVPTEVAVLSPQLMMAVKLPATANALAVVKWATVWVKVVFTVSLRVAPVAVIGTSAMVALPVAVKVPPPS